jgi:hypothetical protein
MYSQRDGEKAIPLLSKQVRLESSLSLILWEIANMTNRENIQYEFTTDTSPRKA